ncbi:hypothetical protein [Buttiauxella sp. S19-1]|uniref:hypothetical protein n=1 Tax=Buttiauxella sp. S19-1 TaxID=941430 RepID=UPI001EDA28C7|nr:hypothetical protein [Buttiauxella sp. S19-1]
MRCPECNKYDALRKEEDGFRCDYCKCRFQLKEKTRYLDVDRHAKHFKASTTTSDKALSLTKMAGAVTANTALFGGSMLVNIAERSLKHSEELFGSEEFKQRRQQVKQQTENYKAELAERGHLRQQLHSDEQKDKP